MFTVRILRLGGAAEEITPRQRSLRFTTAAVGGFGSCTFSVDGDARRYLPYLATIRVYAASWLCWEGRIEDVELAPADDPVTTTVSCFGFQRLLSDITVRRIWSKRSQVWAEAPGGQGAALWAGGAGFKDRNMIVSVGQFDLTDLTKNGVQVAGNSQSIANDATNLADTYLPNGLTVARLMCDYAITGTNTGAAKIDGLLVWSADGTSFSATALGGGSGSLNNSSVSGAKLLRLGAYNNGGAVTPTATDLIRFWNIRVLGTTLTEDTAGGFYGGTILRDLIALVPGLGTGVIETGSDFTIPEIERSIRTTILDTIKEVAGYYAREWAVWDNAVFQWITPSYDDPDWLIPVAQLRAGTRIQTSLDTLGSQVYVLYSLAIDNSLTSEQTAAATDQRNPFAKSGVARHKIVQAPAVMTDSTALAFAQAQAATEVYPPVNGTIVLGATDLIDGVAGPSRPAAAIRAGSTLAIPDIGQFDSVTRDRGRDGQTIFHITSTEVNLDDGTQTLQIEGQANEIDVISSRLAAVTRVATG